MTNEEIVALEALIDKHGLSAVLATIAQTCVEKSAHIQQSYAAGGSTDPLATAWNRAAVIVEAASINTTEVP